MLMLKILGMYKNDGTLVFEKGRSLSWDELSDEIPPVSTKLKKYLSIIR